MSLIREKIFTPVSYTHLDVYKRQYPMRRALASTTVKILQERLFKDYGTPVRIAVSYTHLDVYKRQTLNCTE